MDRGSVIAIYVRPYYTLQGTELRI